MEKKILQTINRARLTAERKLQDIILADEKLLAAKITVEIKLSRIPVDEMPEESEEHIFESQDRAYLNYRPTDDIYISSEIYEVKGKSHE